MPKKSRDKGRRGELEVARIMSAWWLGDSALLEAKAEVLPIRRTPMSGGWAQGKGLGGDLVSVSPEASDFDMFSVEVKNREDWSFDTMLKDRQGWELDTYWDQCTDAAAPAEKIPFLIFTKNRHPWYFCVRNRFWRSLLRTSKARKSPFRVATLRARVYGCLDHFTESFKPAHCLEARGVIYGET